MNAELESDGWPANPEARPSGSFYNALASAQAAFKPITRDKTVTVRTKAGGTYSFSYAPLEAILRATLPSLNKNGFALVQHVEGDHLVTTLYHEHGQLSGSVKVMVSDQGPQAYGSALTYARRYGVTLLLGICADDDDDGNAAEGNEVTVHEERDRNTFTSEKRELYLKPVCQALEMGDADHFKQLINELNEGERRGLWFYLSTKQKAQARDIMQGRVETEAGVRG